MAIAPFPHHYTVSLEDGALRAGPRPAIAVGAPPQFGGDERVWSPEELFVGAAVLCLKTTFDAYASADALHIDGWRAGATGTLVKTRDGPAFSGIAIEVELRVAAADADRARTILERAERRCIITAAMKPPVSVAVTVVHSAADHAVP